MIGLLDELIGILSTLIGEGTDIETAGEELEDLNQDQLDELSDYEGIAEIMWAAGADRTGAEDEYTAAAGAGEGIAEENKQYYEDAKLRFSRNPETGSVKIEKYDEESGTWVGMKWIPEETAQAMIDEYNKRKSPAPQQNEQQGTPPEQESISEAAAEVNQTLDDQDDQIETQSQGGDGGSPTTTITTNDTTKAAAFAEEELDKLGIKSPFLTPEETGKHGKDGYYDTYNTTSGAKVSIFNDPSAAQTTSGKPKAMTIKVPASEAGKEKGYSTEVYQYTINENGEYEQTDHFYEGKS